MRSLGVITLIMIGCGGGGGEADSIISPEAIEVEFEGGLQDENEVTEEEIVCLPQESENGFSDRCEGTIVDKNTGLIWQKECGYEPYAEGKTRCEALELGGFDDWRLPSIDELRSIILGCEKTRPTGVCGVHENCWNQEDPKCWSATGDCFFACANGEGPGPDGCYMDGLFIQPCQNYWSSTQAKMSGLGDKKAWTVSFVDGSISPASQSNYNFVRCVRGP